MRRTAGATLAALALLTAVGLLAWGLGVVELPGTDTHGEAEVTVSDPDGTTLATVDARVADTRQERIRGLSETDSLANGTGMLFIHPSAANYTYVMRDMDFPLDILFVEPCEDCPADVDGRVTIVHHADVPPDGEASPKYSGYGRWVLEVPQGYANATGMDEGDHVGIRYRNGS